MRLLFLFITLTISIRPQAQDYIQYNPSPENPYGLPNPEAPPQITDYQEMIGKCKCKSVSRISQTEWADTVEMIWEFKYIMNGKAVQDLTYKADGAHSGSIRQFDPDSSRWNVHYFASNSQVATLPAWTGNRIDDEMILYRPQVAPNGMEGFMRLTFFKLSETGYDWVGEWVDTTKTIVYPTWKIFCSRLKD